MPLFIKQEIHIEGNWYAPEKYLNQLKNVVYVNLINTTSSAGDWDGFFIQKRYNKYYLIEFSQLNNYPHEGFTLYTSNIRAEVVGNLSPDEWDQIFCEEIYN